MIAAVMAGAAGLAVIGAVAYGSVLQRHQRRMPWRTVRLYVPQTVQVQPDDLKALLAAIWGKLRRSPLSALLYGQPRLACEIRADATGTCYYWAVPATELGYLRHLVASCLPGVICEEADDPMVAGPSAGKPLAVRTVMLGRPAAYPIAEFQRQFPVMLGGLLDGLRARGEVTVQVLLRPARDSEWKPAARAELLRSEGKAPRGGRFTETVNSAIGGLFDAASGRTVANSSPQLVTSRLERTATRDTPAKLLTSGFDVQLRIMAMADGKEGAESLAAQTSAIFAGLNGANHLVPRAPGLFTAPGGLWREWAQRRGPVHAGQMILTPEELTSLIYPVARAQAQGGVRVIELGRQPPADGIHLCDAQYQGRRVPVRITPRDLDTHLSILGMTGHGKGVLQEHLFREIARSGMGGVYIDPLGGSVRKLLASLPDECMDRVVFIQAGNPRWAIPLNFLVGDDHEAIAASAMSLYYRLWGDAWGKSTEEALRAATIAVIQAGGALPEMELVLSSPGYRRSILPRVRSGPIRHFLQSLPDKLNDHLRAPLNKLHELLWQDAILAMVGQTDALNWRQLILNRNLVLVDLNKGNPAVGPMGAALVAGIVWSRIGSAGLSIPVDKRVRFVQVADEIRDVAARTPEDFEMAFSQYRQFLLPVVAASQNLRQLPERLITSLTGNVGSKLVLREDPPHSRDAIEFVGAGGKLQESDLATLPPLVGFANLVMDGRPTGVFTAWAPPFSEPLRDPDEAAEQCLRQWARPRVEVLDAINKRIQAAAGGTGTPELD